MRTDLVVLDSERLNRRRLALGLTRVDVALAANACSTSVYSALRGRPVSVRIARAVAEALGVRLKDVLRDVVIAGDGEADGNYTVEVACDIDGDEGYGKK